MLMYHTSECAKSRLNPESHWLVNFLILYEVLIRTNAIFYFVTVVSILYFLLWYILRSNKTLKMPIKIKKTWNCVTRCA